MPGARRPASELNIHCHWCGNLFYAKKRASIYCSMKCSGLARRTGERLCWQCGSYFKPRPSQRFCCRRCANEFNNTTHGKTGTRLYIIWKSVKNRCYCPSAGGYEYYGGRGITMDEAWKQSFDIFESWALANGYANHLWIERNNSNENYCPGNCSWKTPKEQAANRRNADKMYLNLL